MEKNLTPVPVVAAALIDAKGRVLMQKRRNDREHGGLWEFPGGKVEPGEAPESALIREIAEELGIALPEASLQWIARAGGTGDPVVISLYSCRQWQGEPQLLDAAQLAWVDPKDLAALAMPPLDVVLVRELLLGI